MDEDDCDYIIDYKYHGGDAPVPLISANANGDTLINILDVVYISNYLYHGGPAPDCE